MCSRTWTMILFAHILLHNFRMQGPPLFKKKYTIPFLLWATSTNERQMSRHMLKNSRRTLFPRTRTGAQIQNVGGQEVMQLRTAGSKVVPQLTRLLSGGERSRPRGHSRLGSLPKQTSMRKPRDPMRLQMFQSNWTHLWAVISRMVTSCIHPYMQLRMMQTSLKSGQ